MWKMGQQARVLIVDDDRMMAKTLADIVRFKGFQAEVAHAAAEALQYLEATSFDCVLSDIKLEGMDGIELYGAIKTRLPDMPVVLMTAYSADEDITAGLQAGVVHILTKPVDINRVLAFLEAVSRPKLVLLVVDDPAVRQAWTERLQTHGYHVRPAAIPWDEAPVALDVVAALLVVATNVTLMLDWLATFRRRHRTLPIVVHAGLSRGDTRAIAAVAARDKHMFLLVNGQTDGVLRVLSQVRIRQLGRLLN
jgi:DNA-binding response OmpR family regulator